MLIVERYSETRLFRHLSNNVFATLQFWKYISYEGHFFLQKVQNLMYISQMVQQIHKEFFVS